MATTQLRVKKNKAREERRRRAYWELHYSGQPREELTAEAAERVLRAIDKNDISQFGIEFLAKYDLEIDIETPKWVRQCRMPVLQYAALRGRDRIVDVLRKANVSIKPQQWLLQTDPGEVNSTVLIAASRAMEAGDDEYNWKWVLKDTSGRSNWHGCGCSVDPEEFWDKMRHEDLKCPRCGDATMPPLASLLTVKRRRKRRDDDRTLDRNDDAVRILFASVKRGDVAYLRDHDGLHIVRDDAGAPLAAYAAIRGDHAMLQALDVSLDDLATPLAPLESPFRVSLKDVLHARTRPRSSSLLQGERRDTVYGPAFVVDDAISEDLARALDDLYDVSPVCGGRKNDGIDRRAFLDASGILDLALTDALGSSVCLAPKAKFLQYRDEDTDLAPHIDLCKKTDWLSPSHRLSTTHTWIVYLTTCPRGGETVLLDDVRTSSNDVRVFLDGVRPVRRRLFVFPHRHPHAGRPTGETTKRIARGELFFWHSD